jgi:hypothetical protein
MIGDTCTCFDRLRPPDGRLQDYTRALERHERLHGPTIQDLTRAGLIKPPVAIQGKYLGETLHAKILRNVEVTCHNKEETVEAGVVIRYQEQKYTADTLAGAAALGRKLILKALAVPYQGITESSWKFRNEHGDWKPLRRLRGRPRHNRPSGDGGAASEKPVLVPLQCKVAGVTFEADLDLNDWKVLYQGRWYVDLGEATRAAEADLFHDRDRFHETDKLDAWRFWSISVDGKSNSEPMANLRAEWWTGLKSVSADELESWWHHHTAGGRDRISFRRWLYLAVVGGSVKGRCRQFTRSVMFPLVDLPDGDTLGCGDVLVNHDHQHSPNDPKGVIQGQPTLRVFPARKYIPATAWRCTNCSNYWVVDRRGTTCPRCSSPHVRRPSKVWVQRHWTDFREETDHDN